MWNLYNLVFGYIIWVTREAGNGNKPETEHVAIRYVRGRLEYYGDNGKIKFCVYPTLHNFEASYIGTKIILTRPQKFKHSVQIII